MKIQTTREDHLIAWFAALAITIHITESALPSLIPGVKPGLANVITIIVLMKYGWRIAAWVSLLRVLAASLLIGTFLSPTFILSLSGALASIVILGLLNLLPEKTFTAYGYSIAAAMAHTMSQFFVAYYLFIQHDGLFYLLPILMTTAFLFGILNAMIVMAIMLKLNLYHNT